MLPQGKGSESFQRKREDVKAQHKGSGKNPGKTWVQEFRVGVNMP